MIPGYSEKLGTPINDSLEGLRQEVVYGLEGDDTLTLGYTIDEEVEGDDAVFIGGSGNDRYIVNDNQRIVILDGSNSDNDILKADGISFNNENTFVLEYFDSALWLFDTLNQQFALIPDWQNPENRIEEFQLQDQTLSYDQFVQAVENSGKYVGNFTSSQTITLPNGEEFEVSISGDLEEFNSVNQEIIDRGKYIETNYSQFSLTKIHRFYQYEKGFHFYTSGANEIKVIQEKSATGELAYNYESEKFTVLSDDKDPLTGESLAGVKPVYRFFNIDTGAHLYTMSEKEKGYIQDNLTNYNFEGIKYYAFETEPENIDTVPVFRMLNGQSGTHLFTTGQKEIDYIQQNLPHFSLEGDNGIAFYVFEL
jgi:hypothetical protein